MSTVPETIKIISDNVQGVFEELTKLLLRKTLKPSINPINHGNKIVYNAYKKRYERGFLGSVSDDCVNKYTYSMTNASLGWTDEVLANFKTSPKFIKSSDINRQAYISNSCRSSCRNKKPSRPCTVPKPIDSNTVLTTTAYKNLLSVLSSKSLQGAILNKRTSSSYTTDIPYTLSFKQLENIGQDIIDQTDRSICPDDSARMSTAMLRARLFNLDRNLSCMSVDDPEIFNSYIDMIKIINSVQRTSMVWVINLIASLSYQSWEKLSNHQQSSYIDALGEEFINAFMSNQMITILLQSENSDLILSGSYLYPLIKMLFIVFNYSKLVPNVSEDMCNNRTLNGERIRKHIDKYKGAYLRRGDYVDLPCLVEEIDLDIPENVDMDVPKLIRTPEGIIVEDELKESDEFINPDPEPVDIYIYEFIKLFGELYPTLVGLMGGTEEFPPESIQISCSDVPSSYCNLYSIPEYLWRFNDYSYCRYIEHIASKQLVSALGTKISAKVRHLKSL